MTIAVLEKSFRTLEAMSELGEPISLKQMVAATGLPKPTLHRILRTLSDLGYVDQDAERHGYRLTPRLLRLTRGASFTDLVEKALPSMEALHGRFNETVNLGVLRGHHVYYAHVIETTQSLRWQVRPGRRDPYHTTALGRAIVAHLPEERMAKLVATTKIDAQTSFTPTDEAALKAILETTRTRGLAIDDQENDLGVVCLSVPFDNDLGVAAAISISVPKSRMSPALQKRVGDALRSLNRRPAPR